MSDETPGAPATAATDAHRIYAAAGGHAPHVPIQPRPRLASPLEWGSDQRVPVINHWRRARGDSSHDTTGAVRGQALLYMASYYDASSVRPPSQSEPGRPCVPWLRACARGGERRTDLPCPGRGGWRGERGGVGDGWYGSLLFKALFSSLKIL